MRNKDSVYCIHQLLFQVIVIYQIVNNLHLLLLSKFPFVQF